MAYKAFTEKYFKQMIAFAKRIKDGAPEAADAAQLSYAFMPDKDSGEHEFTLDNTLAPEALFKRLRSHANAERGKKKKKKLTKGSWGTCRVKGSTLYLSPDQTVPSLRELVKRMLNGEKAKAWKLKTCKLVDAAQPLPEGEDDEPEAEDASTPRDEAEAAAPATQDVDENEAEDPSAAPEDAPPEDASGSGVSDNPFEAGDAGDAGDAGGASNPFTGEVADAEPEADATAAELEELAAAVAQGSEAWQKAVQGAARDVKKLEKAVAQLDDPRADAVVERLRVLVKDLPGMDKQLDKFLAAARKQDAKGAAKCKKDLQKAVKDCRVYVEEEDLIDIAEANPISRVKLRAPLSKALTQVEKALK